MSAPRKIGAAERTATMLDLLRQRYEAERGMSLSHVMIEEVAPSTGFSAVSRWADALVLSTWPSKGLTLDGYEIKASRADLKKELSDPSKAEALARYCDSWTLVAWDESVLLDGIPEHWGIILTTEKDGVREFVTKRRPAPRTPEPWPRAFVCSLVRNAHMQSPGAAYVARAVQSTVERLYAERRRTEKEAVKVVLHPLARALYGNDTWRWPKEAHDPEHLIKEAIARIDTLAGALT